MAWVVQTRPDIALFVSALQRKLQAPCGKDVVGLTRVLAYVKSKPMKMTYHKLSKPWRLHVISDSSFGSEDDDALAMRSGVIALGKKRWTACKLSSNSWACVEEANPNMQINNRR